jgi:hypothetical protein
MQLNEFGSKQHNNQQIIGNIKIIKINLLKLRHLDGRSCQSQIKEIVYSTDGLKTVDSLQ